LELLIRTSRQHISFTIQIGNHLISSLKVWWRSLENLILFTVSTKLIIHERTWTLIKKSSCQTQQDRILWKELSWSECFREERRIFRSSPSEAFQHFQGKLQVYDKTLGELNILNKLKMKWKKIKWNKYFKHQRSLNSKPWKTFYSKISRTSNLSCRLLEKTEEKRWKLTSNLDQIIRNQKLQSTNWFYNQSQLSQMIWREKCLPPIFRLKVLLVMKNLKHFYNQLLTVKQT